MTLSDTFFKYYINFNFYIMGNSNSTKSDVGDALKSTIPAIAGTIASAIITVLINKKK